MLENTPPHVFGLILLFGQLHQLSADKIYPTNENRHYITSKQIFTNFAKKEPAKLSKPEKALQIQLNKDRSTVLEGSFGKHKNHYGLRKVKARDTQNERVWFFLVSWLQMLRN